ncbi:hypothetical protein ACQ4WX_49430 [Streptomyces lasalocidi]
MRWQALKSISSKSAGFGRPALIAAVIAGFLSIASPAQAQAYSTCDQWGQYSQGNWTIYNNIWGQNHGPQCLTVNSIKSWYVDANHSGGGIKSYPNTAVRPQTPLSQLNSAGFWYNTSSTPVSGSDYWDWTSDFWSTGNQDEIMVFTSWSGTAGGWGRQIASNVTIGGVLYASVWRGRSRLERPAAHPRPADQHRHHRRLGGLAMGRVAEPPAQHHLRHDAVRHRNHLDQRRAEAVLAELLQRLVEQHLRWRIKHLAVIRATRRYAPSAHGDERRSDSHTHALPPGLERQIPAARCAEPSNRCAVPGDEGRTPASRHLVARPVGGGAHSGTPELTVRRPWATRAVVDVNPATDRVWRPLRPTAAPGVQAYVEAALGMAHGVAMPSSCPSLRGRR